MDEEEDIPKKELEEMKKHMFSFFEDVELIKYLNKNFICYKFNPATESLVFQENEYKRTEGQSLVI